MNYRHRSCRHPFRTTHLPGEGEAGSATHLQGKGPRKPWRGAALPLLWTSTPSARFAMLKIDKKRHDGPCAAPNEVETVA